MSIRYAHTNIISKNWKALSEFYEKVFDCVFVPPQRSQSGAWLETATGVATPALEGVHLRLPGHGEHGPTLEIFSYNNMLEAETPVANRKGYGHLAFEVDNVGETLNAVLQAGGKALGSIVTKEVPGVGLITLIYATDPEGNIIELQHWDYTKA